MIQKLNIGIGDKAGINSPLFSKFTLAHCCWKKNCKKIFYTLWQTNM